MNRNWNAHAPRSETSSLIISRRGTKKTLRSLHSFPHRKSSGASLTSKWNTPRLQKDSGKVGVETRLTPARRFSYIVGEGESCHTAQTRFLDLLQDTQTDPTLAEIEEAFSVEAVTKEFFTKYAELIREISTRRWKSSSQKDKAMREEFTVKGSQHRGLRQEAHGPDRVPVLPPKEGLAWRREGEGLGHGAARLPPAAGRRRIRQVREFL